VPAFFISSPEGDDACLATIPNPAVRQPGTGAKRRLRPNSSSGIQPGRSSLPLPLAGSLESSDYQLFPGIVLIPNGLQTSSFIAATYEVQMTMRPTAS